MEPSRRTEIVYRSASQKALLEKLGKVAATNAEVLITGPSGVGKELYAHYTHEKSPRRDRPFVAVNCSNLPSHLLENEVFGHARGAYTGADSSIGGIVQAADGGSMFLDEVETLPMASQAKLLRFIQTREYRRLGETTLRRADIRFIAASNADLERLVGNGRFRKDLYFRLRVVPVDVEPLSARREDIEPLIDHFVVHYADEYKLEPVRLGAAALRRLKAHAWPGNVRELENCVRYLTCMQLGRPVEPKDLDLKAQGLLAGDRPLAVEYDDDEVAEEKPRNGRRVNGTSAKSLREAKQNVVTVFERDYIARALESAGGNIAEAARKSGKHRRAFFELMRKHGFDVADYRH
jgi:DNA-binding NtrC family response regulator